MDWDDLDDILYDGTEEEIKKARCPVCGNEISFEYSETATSNTFAVRCESCHILHRSHNGPKPNCVKYFGSGYTIKIS